MNDSLSEHLFQTFCPSMQISLPIAHIRCQKSACHGTTMKTLLNKTLTSLHDVTMSCDESESIIGMFQTQTHIDPGTE